MSPVEVITLVQKRSIQINFLGGGVFSMKVPFKLPKVRSLLFL